MNRFAFFCTDNAGWEYDDYRLLATTLVVLLVVVGAYWFLVRRVKNKIIRLLLSVIAVIGALIAIGAGALVVYVAPC